LNLQRLALVLLAVAIALRLYGLDRLPGINGDETWLAVQVQHLLRGQPFLLRTPTRMFINPLLVASEAGLLTALPPSGWTLRLPVALWGIAGLALFAWLAQRLWQNRQQTLLAAALLACAPLAVAYGHCAWDPSFLLVVAPLVWLPALRLVDQRANRMDVALLTVGTLACLWVHLTSGLMLAVLAIGAWRLYSPSRRVTMGLLAIGLGLALGLALVAGLGTPALSLLAERPLRFLSQPPAALHLFALPGLLLTGGRAFGFFAGMPETPLVWSVAALATLGLGGLAWRLRTSEVASDRLLAWSWLLLPLPWWLAAGLLLPQSPGRERYVVWILVPAVLLVTRGLKDAPRLLLAVAATSALLSGAWLYAVDQQLWPETTHRAFRTGPIEPKIALAKRIVQLSPPGQPLRIAVADWWLEHPLRYLLPPDAEIGPDVAAPQWRVVWASQSSQTYPETLYDAQDRPILSLVRP
jgi:hypothetical protein